MHAFHLFEARRQCVLAYCSLIWFWKALFVFFTFCESCKLFFLFKILERVYSFLLLRYFSHSIRNKIVFPIIWIPLRLKRNIYVSHSSHIDTARSLLQHRTPKNIFSPVFVFGRFAFCKRVAHCEKKSNTFGSQSKTIVFFQMRIVLRSERANNKSQQRTHNAFLIMMYYLYVYIDICNKNNKILPFKS